VLAVFPVIFGTGIMRRVPVRTLRVVTALVLAVFAVVAAVSAITG
jgi:putative Ca2+/H+ antiporter (TMEM165/GDT1 family)